jgi:hypothetical protein
MSHDPLAQQSSSKNSENDSAKVNSSDSNGNDLEEPVLWKTIRRYMALNESLVVMIPIGNLEEALQQSLQSVSVPTHNFSQS